MKDKKGKKKKDWKILPPPKKFSRLKGGGGRQSPRGAFSRRGNLGGG